MAKRISRKLVNRQKYYDYNIVAQQFYEAAKVAKDFKYWNAAGVLIVHAAIAYTDAISIKNSGQKSSSENHEDAIALVDSLAADGDEKKKAMNQLRKIIAEETMVFYAGDLYDEKDVENMWKWLLRFRNWAVGIVDR
ncbi:MAG: hypothetical protein QME25_02340 [Bacteroidota bacterium]|nr:hypothetical protein [Bacteroidota bacterium]